MAMAGTWLFAFILVTVLCQTKSESPNREALRRSQSLRVTNESALLTNSVGGSQKQVVFTQSPHRSSHSRRMRVDPRIQSFAVGNVTLGIDRVGGERNGAPIQVFAQPSPGQAAQEAGAGSLKPPTSRTHGHRFMATLGSRFLQRLWGRLRSSNINGDPLQQQRNSQNLTSKRSLQVAPVITQHNLTGKLPLQVAPVITQHNLTGKLPLQVAPVITQHNLTGKLPLQVAPVITQHNLTGKLPLQIVPFIAQQNRRKVIAIKPTKNSWGILWSPSCCGQSKAETKDNHVILSPALSRGWSNMTKFLKLSLSTFGLQLFRKHHRRRGRIAGRENLPLFSRRALVCNLLIKQRRNVLSLEGDSKKKFSTGGFLNIFKAMLAHANEVNFRRLSITPKGDGSKRHLINSCWLFHSSRPSRHDHLKVALRERNAHFHHHTNCSGENKKKHASKRSIGKCLQNYLRLLNVNKKNTGKQSLPLNTEYFNKKMRQIILIPIKTSPHVFSPLQSLQKLGRKHSHGNNMKRCLPLLIRLSRRCYVLGKFWERVTHAVSGCNIGGMEDGITKAVLHLVTNNKQIKGWMLLPWRCSEHLGF